MTRPTCVDTFLIKKRNLKNQYYSIILGPFDRARDCRPGSFLHLQLPDSDVYFRRPMSVAGIDGEGRTVEIIFRVFGHGTTILSRYERDDRVGLLGPLGVTFTLPKKSETAVMVAGGVGFPPLLFLATRMVEQGFRPENIRFFYGGRSKADILERARIKKLGIKLVPVTEDGSVGTRGLVVEPVESFLREADPKKTRMYGCGPDGMLQAVNQLGLTYSINGQLSLEAPMPCGVGICLGCVVPLAKGGYARVCREGPVFEIGEVAW